MKLKLSIGPVLPFLPFNIDFQIYLFIWSSFSRYHKPEILNILIFIVQLIHFKQQQKYSGTSVIPHTQGTREMWRMIQDVKILGFFFS
jgi:hypothetical protein